jgi:hypothetical protein
MIDSLIIQHMPDKLGSEALPQKDPRKGFNNVLGTKIAQANSPDVDVVNQNTSAGSLDNAEQSL